MNETSGAEGTWFVAAKSARLFDEALAPADPLQQARTPVASESSASGFVTKLLSPKLGIA